MVIGREKTPWVSFCMSTFKRPGILENQLRLILQQTFQDFEVVISDNDPEMSAEVIVKSIGDPRLKYFSNGVNLGMAKSFNKSIERATADYIVMITDDDPVIPEMLEIFHGLIKRYSGFSIYMGCERTGKGADEVEVFGKNELGFQILNPVLTPNILWSSCVLRKDAAKAVGGMPDYGSPHLADHALLMLCGCINGGVMINRMFSNLTSHGMNFSKGNVHLYYIACLEFYNLILKTDRKKTYIKNGEDALILHLHRWFIVSMFVLRKYYTYKNKSKEMISQVEAEVKKMLSLPFMKTVRHRYYLKLAIFYLKMPLYVLKILR